MTVPRIHPQALTALASALLCLFLLGGCAGPAYQPSPGLRGYSETGLATFYAKKFQGRKTASGERLDNSALTAAHRSLPFGTEVVVRNPANGKSVRVRINDRGPFVRGRIIDLTRTAFARIASLDRGVVKVELRVAK
jgi:rare lipoprotein A